MSETAIYLLRDPRTDEVRYVGKTVNPVRRMRNLVSEVHHYESHKTRWLKLLFDLGLRPIMEIVEWVDSDEWQQREIEAIARYRAAGCPLTNTHDGGVGNSGGARGIKRRRLPSHCGNGHEYTQANTYVRPDGHRACRTCINGAMARYRERDREHVRAIQRRSKAKQRKVVNSE